MLGEAPPPLVAEPEDRAGGRSNGRERRKARSQGSSPSPVRGRRKPRRRSWKLGAPNKPEEPESDEGFRQAGDEDTRADPLVAEPEDRAGGRGWARASRKARLRGSSPPPGSRKAEAPAAIVEAGSAEAKPESETALGKRGDEDAGADAIVVRAAGATTVANGAEIRRREARGPPRPNPVGLSWRARARSGRPPDGGRGGGDRGSELAAWFASAGGVEPGMLADQPTKVMAPSAALATVPPREEPNVARERPQVHATRETRSRRSCRSKSPQATGIAACGVCVPNPFPGRRICHCGETCSPNARSAGCGWADAYGLRPGVAARVRRARCGLETRESRLAPATGFGSRRCSACRRCAGARS